MGGISSRPVQHARQVDQRAHAGLPVPPASARSRRERESAAIIFRGLARQLLDSARQVGRSATGRLQVVDARPCSQEMLDRRRSAANQVVRRSPRGGDEAPTGRPILAAPSAGQSRDAGADMAAGRPLDAACRQDQAEARHSSEEPDRSRSGASPGASITASRRRLSPEPPTLPVSGSVGDRFVQDVRQPTIGSLVISALVSACGHRGGPSQEIN